MPKRFYRSAAIAALDHAFTVELDGRPLKTPAGRPLAVAGRGLAQAVADEWQAQGEDINPRTMPLTGLINTALDRTGGERPAMTEAVLKLAETDLLCYRAETPGDLVELQSETWQPLLDWAERTLEARLAVTRGVLPVDQPAAALAALRNSLSNFSDLRFTAVSSLAATCGSLIVSLALAHRHIDAERAFAAAELDHIYQARLWGDDAEAAARQRTLRADMAAAAAILSPAEE